jgi:hypothetical protein
VRTLSFQPPFLGRPLSPVLQAPELFIHRNSLWQASAGASEDVSTGNAAIDPQARMLRWKEPLIPFR